MELPFQFHQCSCLQGSVTSMISCFSSLCNVSTLAYLMLYLNAALRGRFYDMRCIFEMLISPVSYWFVNVFFGREIVCARWWLRRLAAEVKVICILNKWCDFYFTFSPRWKKGFVAELDTIFSLSLRMSEKTVIWITRKSVCVRVAIVPHHVVRMVQFRRCASAFWKKPVGHCHVKAFFTTF